MLERAYKWIFGDYNEKFVNSLKPTVELVNSKELEYQELSEADFLKNTQNFIERIEKGESLDSLLVEAFATVKNACRRLTEKKHQFTLGNSEETWNMIPYDVQIIGGIVLHQGKIAEMKTGEGKTLVSCFPIYLNALSKKGVHVITVNDYLASRDAEWMGQLFNYLGLSVGVTKHGQSAAAKKEAYESDITYGTNNEFGFDYLRDNMAVKAENQAIRELNYAIIDEVDSILIDEARTPLIISAPAEESTSKYQEYAKLVKNLQKDLHYKLEEKEKAALLTEDGIKKIEELMGIDNIYTEKGFEAVHHIEAALKAQAIFRKDIDYVVKNGEVMIVDEFTGRLMAGRRYSNGLHQAIEAKEGVNIRRESRTLASITFQNFFRLYDKLGGMTGTAETEAKEFGEIYALDTVVIPTNRPIARIDKADAIFKNDHGKYQAIVRRVKEARETKQPVLIGTISIEKSEILSSLLGKEKIPHQVLNAKFHEQEAEIIANAGTEGSVTIATNMAGRGTDIKLTEKSYQAGGLLVIGTERHESRRIDNQLRGRSGRQGDPGESQFFISMDDDVLRLFGSDRMKSMMEMMGLPDDMPIENSMITKSIESAQKKVESRNFDIRKHVLQYDDVMNKHREIIYEKRNQILKDEEIHSEIIHLFEKYLPMIIDNQVIGLRKEEWDFAKVKELLETYASQKISLDNSLEDLMMSDFEAFKKEVIQIFLTAYSVKEKEISRMEVLHFAEKAVYLQNIDRLWMEHINEMTKLRETVSLQAYANKNPLFEYKHAAFAAFKKMMFDISSNTMQDLLRIEIANQVQEIERVAPDAEKLVTNEDAINSQNQRISSPSNPVLVKANSPEYVDKVGRNDPCPCGSGKKYKKCHGK